MKHNLTQLVLVSLIGLLSASSCQEFLTVEQKGKTTIPVFLSYPEGLNAGLVGTYKKTYDYVDNELTKYGDVAGNMLTMRYVGSSTDMLSQYNYVSDATEETGAVGYIWRRIFEAMANANNIIQYQPSVLEAYPQNEEQLQQILGQAFAIRALCHFDLCRVYAQSWRYSDDASHLGVPVLLRAQGPNDNPSRQTVAQVYEQILADLSQAATLLADYQLANGKADIYHFSLEAVQALRARVCLYKQDWTQALQLARTVADAHPIVYADEYIKMFRTFNTPGEAIFRLSGEEQSGKLKPFYDQTALPADTLLGLFEEGDLRLELLYNEGQKYVAKYLVPNAQDAKRDDPMLIRSSEMYLTAAEAACRLGDYTTARKYMEPLLERAIDLAYAFEVLEGTPDGEPLLELILRERTKELCFEGHNFFDLTRCGKDLIRESATNSSLKSLSWPNDRFVLPIPQTELSANLNMQGNPTVNN